jgi:hypothetical protein
MEHAMSPRTIFLSRLIGLFCILAAFSMVVRGRATVDTLALLLADAPLMYMVGVILLVAGLAMVVAHNIWSGGALPVVITFIGWATMIKGLLFLILTTTADTALYLNILHYREYFYGFAAFSLAVGVFLAYGGFRKTP